MNWKPIQKHRRRWGVAAALAAVALLLGWILDGGARILIIRADDTSADYVWICGGQGRFDRAAALYRERPGTRIVLVEPYPERLVRSGVLASPAALARRELAKRGVPAAAVIVIPGSAANAWEETPQLATWLAARPEAEAVLLCDQFNSRRRRYVLDSVMDPDTAQRIHLHPLRDPRYDERNWWRSRGGIKHFSDAALRLVYAWLRGAPAEAPETWTPEEYERALRQHLAEAQP